MRLLALELGQRDRAADADIVAEGRRHDERAALSASSARDGMEPLHRSAMAASKPREKLRLAERCKGPVRAFRVLESSDHLRKHFLRPVGGVERLDS